MRTLRAWVRIAAVIVMLPHAAIGQEIGAYVAGGVGGIRDVRRPFGGGLEGTFLFHDWIGVRADAGYYWTLEHRTALVCKGGAGEAVVCNSLRLASHSHFPMLDGLAVLRGHIPGKGIRFELGAGPTWLDVTNEIRTQTDSIYSPSLSSSAAGFMIFSGVLGHPPWHFPLDLEAAYAYHSTGRFGACTGQQNDPLCGQHLNFHELRFSLFYRTGPRPR